MKKFFHLVASLSIICGLCAAVLAYVNDVTKDAIRDVVANKARDAVKVRMSLSGRTTRGRSSDMPRRALVRAVTVAISC